MDTEALIRDPMAGMRVVGHKLDDLIWSPEVNRERNKYPPVDSLNLSKDVTDYTLIGEV